MSGPTQSDDDRRAAGKVAVKVWLTAGEVAALDTMRGASSRRDAIGAAILAVSGALPLVAHENPDVKITISKR